MLDAARREYGGLLEALPERTFSPVFERRMKKLLRRGQHPVWYRTFHAAACILLALILSGCAVLAVSPEVREAFAGWMLEVYEAAAVYRYASPGRAESAEPVNRGAVYRPSWVPEGDYETSNRDLEAEEPPPLEERRLAWVPAGYQESDRVMMEAQGHVQYQNAEGDLITVGYQRGEVTSLYIIPSNGGELKPQTVLVNGHPADFYLDEDGANALVWAEDGLLFSLLGYCSAGEMIAMAESQEVIAPDGRPASARCAGPAE